MPQGELSSAYGENTYDLFRGILAHVMTGYYDVVLGLIPVSFLAIAAALLAFGLDATVAVSAASVVGVALVGHAMFVNGPVEGTPGADAEPTESPARDTGMAAD